jgi:hypothetical protein
VFVCVCLLVCVCVFITGRRIGLLHLLCYRTARRLQTSIILIRAEQYIVYSVHIYLLRDLLVRVFFFSFSFFLCCFSVRTMDVR